jgi:hypothetical protein
VLQEKLGLANADMAFVGGAAFAYLFHRIDQKELVRLIDDPAVSDRIVSVIKYDGYVLKNCKLYAWAFYKYRRGGPRPKAADFGVAKVDARFLARLNLKHLSMKYDALSLEDYETIVEDIIGGTNLSQYIGKFISKKMTFLIRSFGISRSEIESDVKFAALKAIHLTYPRFESLLHMENVAKSAIHNSGQSLINYHTSPGRQRLYVDQNGDFKARRSADNTQLNSVKAPESYLSHARDQLEMLVKLSKGMRKDVQRFLLCCAGHFDEEFSKFLKDDNSSLVDEIAYSRYLKKTQRFFGYTDEQVQNLFGNLKNQLT